MRSRLLLLLLLLHLYLLRKALRRMSLGAAVMTMTFVAAAVETVVVEGAVHGVAASCIALGERTALVVQEIMARWRGFIRNHALQVWVARDLNEHLH